MPNYGLPRLEGRAPWPGSGPKLPAFRPSARHGPRSAPRISPRERPLRDRQPPRMRFSVWTAVGIGQANALVARVVAVGHGAVDVESPCLSHHGQRLVDNGRPQLSELAFRIRKAARTMLPSSDLALFPRAPETPHRRFQGRMLAFGLRVIIAIARATTSVISAAPISRKNCHRFGGVFPGLIMPPLVKSAIHYLAP